jgi:hypothetical protein
MTKQRILKLKAENKEKNTTNDELEAFKEIKGER